MERVLFIIIVIVSGCFFPLSVYAQTSFSLSGFETNPSAPLEMTSDKLTINQSDGSARFEGNVVVGQGNIRIAAELVIVRYSEAGEIDQLSARGGVTVVTNKESAEAETAEYSLKNRTLVMNGNVMLSQGQILMSSDSLQIDLNTGAAIVQGQVRTILSTGSN